ncbi:MAG: signal peptide peptidase SppA [Rhodospirillaceae bacterium]|nr:signal peptide peptidase SppA [Rhodospirillaceae bacterium]
MRRIARFFLWLFATIGAAVVIGGVGAVLIAVYMPDEELPPRMVLTLDLRGGLVDNRSDDPFEQLRGGSPNYLRRIVEALDAARTDDRVDGLILRLHGDHLRMAHVQELRDAIAAFRESGKWASAHATTFSGVADYAAAAATGEIWMRPSGTVNVTGVAISFPHVKDALATLGVEAQIEQRHEFKSAAETFTRNNMSEPARVSWRAVLKSWFGQLTVELATARDMTEDRVRELIDGAPHIGEAAMQNGLIDKLGYWDGFAAAQRARANVGNGDEAATVSIHDYAQTLEAEPENPSARIALIHGVGEVTSTTASTPFRHDALAADRIAATIRRIAADKEIDGIILRIDSPGGGYGASDSVWRAVKFAREKGKRVVASLGVVAASGGYFIAMGADRIVAQPATLTGSIGVFGGKIVLSELWRKLGVNWEQIRVGAQAGMWSPHWPFEPGAQARQRAILDHIYQDFTEKAAADRGLDGPGIDAAARGRVWTGVDAKRLGLVDRLGGLTTAVGEMRDLLKLAADAPVALVVRPAARTPLEQALEVLKESQSPFTALEALVTSYYQGPGWEMRRWGRLVGSLMDGFSMRPAPVGELQLPPYLVSP